MAKLTAQELIDAIKEMTLLELMRPSLDGRLAMLAIPAASYTVPSTTPALISSFYR